MDNSVEDDSCEARKFEENPLQRLICNGGVDETKLAHVTIVEGHEYPRITLAVEKRSVDGPRYPLRITAHLPQTPCYNRGLRGTSPSRPQPQKAIR